MSSFPLTNISIYFSEGLVNHQPDQQTQTSNKDNLKVVRLPQDPDGSSDSQCHLDQDVYLYGAGFQTLCLRLWTIASASGSRRGVNGEFRSCGGELKDWTGQAATPCKKGARDGVVKIFGVQKTWPFWIWHRFLNHTNHIIIIIGQPRCWVDLGVVGSRFKMIYPLDPSGKLT